LNEPLIETEAGIGGYQASAEPQIVRETRTCGFDLPGRALDATYRLNKSLMEKHERCRAYVTTRCATRSRWSTTGLRTDQSAGYQAALDLCRAVGRDIRWIKRWWNAEHQQGRGTGTQPKKL